MTAGAVQAAGGVVWRVAGGTVRVLVVHRRKYHDVTLPKGKVEAGETLVETAVREVHEESGIRAALGVPLGQVRYALPSGRDKVVHYWAMRARDRAVRASDFAPTKEITAAEWVDLDRAPDRLSHELDAEILKRFVERYEAGARRTFPLIALRHAQAAPRDAWNRVDHLRPLTPRGQRQAKALVGPLRAFGVKKIVTSSATRCVQTVTPLAVALGRPATQTDAISQDAWEDGLEDVRGIVAKRLASAKPAVLASHGPVLPGIVAELALASGSPPSAVADAPPLPTAGFTVVHLSADPGTARIVALESHAPLS